MNLKITTKLEFVTNRHIIDNIKKINLKKKKKRSLMISCLISNFRGS